MRCDCSEPEGQDSEFQFHGELWFRSPLTWAMTKANDNENLGAKDVDATTKAGPKKPLNRPCVCVCATSVELYVELK